MWMKTRDYIDEKVEKYIYLMVIWEEKTVRKQLTAVAALNDQPYRVSLLSELKGACEREMAIDSVAKWQGVKINPTIGMMKHNH